MLRKSQTIILDKIEDENNKAEIFASYAQLLFLIFVLIVYVVSPKGFKPKGFSATNFEPVKFAFYIYLPIILLRTYLALKIKLKQWLIFIFLFIDALVLTTLIWSFHIQYDAPFTLSLRAPTFLYFFVFLALRTLSFRVSQVLFFVVSFLVLWSGMTWIAFNDAELILTKNFKEYLQANAFILGVEIDKMLAVLTVGVIIAVSIYRKGRLLTRLAEQFVKEAAMESLVGRGTLKSFNFLESDLTPGQVQRRLGSTLLVDLRGFSKLSYVLSSEELLVLLGEYQNIVAQRVFELGGVVDKYLGDGILAHFGVASELQDFAARSIRAAELINKDLGVWIKKRTNAEVSLGFGIAVTHGIVAFGVIGHIEKMEITVLGESVNLAAKLEKHTKLINLPIVTLASTYELAIKQGYSSNTETIKFDLIKIEGIPEKQNLIAFK